ncbi:MAG: hypothetical protein ACK44Z_12715, partial [Pirellulaceae bacterium]
MLDLRGDYAPACGSHHRQMVDWLVGRLAQHSTAWPRWLRSVVTTRMLDLRGDYAPACGSHHRPMVDWLVGRLAQHSTAWPRWLRSVVTTG